MMQRLKQRWRDLKNEDPGKRFQASYERRQKKRRSAWQKPALLTLGGLMTLAGIVMLVTPGPGIAALLVGLGLLAQESYYAARALDSAELYVRDLFGRVRRWWHRGVKQRAPKH